ncbi:MAG: hypothetical protein VKJ06_09320 [Vampirovibrionales bacterium]|nr:hypothetical protein [Vampirovibrionales bacterium]
MMEINGGTFKPNMPPGGYGIQTAKNYQKLLDTNPAQATSVSIRWGAPDNLRVESVSF